MALFSNIFGKNKNSEAVPKPETEKNTVYSPISGELIKLSDFPDEVFSEGVLGEGCGIIPKGNVIASPFNGSVKYAADTKHAVGLVSDDGIEIVIHIGVDTVEMNGNGFKSLVNQGEVIIKGQPLIEFDSKRIEAAGYKDTIAVAVTNSDEYSAIESVPEGTVKAGDIIIRAS